MSKTCALWLNNQLDCFAFIVCDYLLPEFFPKYLKLCVQTSDIISIIIREISLDWSFFLVTAMQILFLALNITLHYLAPLNLRTLWRYIN